MIDIHSHILPEIDDGAKDISESLALLRLAQEDGITHLVATPHMHFGRFDNSAELIKQQFDIFRSIVAKADINIKLAVAAEVRLDLEIMPLVKQQKLPFIGQINGVNYVLLELPHSHMPVGFENFIRWLVKQNIVPVIPHPERNRDIQKNVAYLTQLKKLGCELQLTAASVIGHFGVQAQQLSEYILAHRLADYVASDMHSVKRRPPMLTLAHERICRFSDLAYAHELFYSNPKRLTQSLFSQYDNQA